MLSKLITKARDSPSAFPTETSCGIFRTVEVTSAMRTLLRYEYAALRVRRSTGRRPIEAGKFAHIISNCFIGAYEAGVISHVVPMRLGSGKRLRLSRDAVDRLQLSLVLQSPRAPYERHCG